MKTGNYHECLISIWSKTRLFTNWNDVPRFVTTCNHSQESSDAPLWPFVSGPIWFRSHSVQLLVSFMGTNHATPSQSMTTENSPNLFSWHSNFYNGPIIQSHGLGSVWNGPEDRTTVIASSHGYPVAKHNILHSHILELIWFYKLILTSSNNHTWSSWIVP